MEAVRLKTPRYFGLTDTIAVKCDNHVPSIIVASEGAQNRSVGDRRKVRWMPASSIGENAPDDGDGGDAETVAARDMAVLPASIVHADVGEVVTPTETEAVRGEAGSCVNPVETRRTRRTLRPRTALTFMRLG